MKDKPEIRLLNVVHTRRFLLILVALCIIIWVFLFVFSPYDKPFHVNSYKQISTVFENLIDLQKALDAAWLEKDAMKSFYDFS